MKGYFSPNELKCKCGKCESDGTEMDSTFMLNLTMLRVMVDAPLVVTSAFRCKDHPVESRKTRPGVHAQGKAVDLKVSYELAYEVTRAAFLLGFSGVGVSQQGDTSSRFIHIDTGTGDNRPRVWSY